MGSARGGLGRRGVIESESLSESVGRASPSPERVWGSRTGDGEAEGRGDGEAGGKSRERGRREGGGGRDSGGC